MKNLIQNFSDEESAKPKQELFEEMNVHLLNDASPSEYFNGLAETEAFEQYPLVMLKNLKDTNQSPVHHPEGNVWNHTMLVIDAAAQVKAKSSDQKAFMWAALLHDIGKPDTTRNRKGKITSYDHDKLGAEMAEKFLRQFKTDTEFVEKVVALVRWHMQILFVVNNLPFANIESMSEQISVQEVALLGLCDRLGRLGADRKKEKETINLFLQKCQHFCENGTRDFQKRRPRHGA